MSRTRVKICGITRLEDALTAAEYGADAIGLVRHRQSPRCVADAVACEIIDALPAFVTPVMLFVNEAPGVIRRSAAGMGFHVAQFHGEEGSVEVVEVAPLRVIKAIRVEEAHIRMQLTQWQRIRPANLAGLVLETPGRLGGSGVENDWDLIRRLRDEGYLDGPVPIILAGGLTPDNVGRIVREFRPFAVDVSSGVEEGVRGVKS
ncbi:MAG: phosphoribosylanthranilate isomerase, partial [Phycisphaerae bacterium]|nr:phosphoribosylanthranilate isomerase [Phycisphaerae bacterium]